MFLDSGKEIKKLMSDQGSYVVYCFGMKMYIAYKDM